MPIACATEPRLISVDTALKTIRSQIPDPPGSQVNADDLFERLGSCHELLAKVQALKQENAAKQNEVMAQVGKLKRLAIQLEAVSDAAEVRNITSQLPEQLPPERFLDVTIGELNRLDQALNGLLTKVLQRASSELVRLRRENLSWIRLLAPITPEAENFTATGPVPDDLDALHTDLDVERSNQQRIAELSLTAANQLAQRREAVEQRLQYHLMTPAFETHPERDKAQSLHAGLQFFEALHQPGRQPRQEELSRARDLVIDAEEFIDRIEATQKEIPERLAVLEERFTRLRELNGIGYRPDLARRVNTLLMGIQKGISLEQWEALKSQLEETNTLLSALERDAILRIAAETEEVVKQLKLKKAKKSADRQLVRDIDSAIAQLEEEGHLEPPAYATRRRMNRLLDR